MSNDYILDDADDEHKEACAIEIATRAAKLVASSDMGRDDAIEAAANELRQEIAAGNDVTGVLATMIDVTTPSKEIPPTQVEAIKEELMDAARDAAETL